MGDGKGQEGARRAAVSGGGAGGGLFMSGLRVDWNEDRPRCLLPCIVVAAGRRAGVLQRGEADDAL